MSILSSSITTLPFDIEQLLISFLEHKDHKQLRITNYKLYNQLPTDYVEQHLIEYSEDVIIYFIDNMHIKADVYSWLYLYDLGLIKVVKHLIEATRTPSPMKINMLIESAVLNGDLNNVKYFCSLAFQGTLWYRIKDVLHMAVERGHLDIVKYLCSLDCVDPSYNNNFVLHMTCRCDDSVYQHKILEIIKYLCSFDSVRSKITKETIEDVIRESHLDIVKYFLSLDVINLDDDKDLLLSSAFSSGRTDVTEYLRSIGYENADVINNDCLRLTDHLFVESFDHLRNNGVTSIVDHHAFMSDVMEVI